MNNTELKEQCELFRIPTKKDFKLMIFSVLAITSLGAGIVNCHVLTADQLKVCMDLLTGGVFLCGIPYIYGRN